MSRLRQKNARLVGEGSRAWSKAKYGALIGILPVLSLDGGCLWVRASCIAKQPRSLELVVWQVVDDLQRLDYPR